MVEKALLLDLPLLLRLLFCLFLRALLRLFSSVECLKAKFYRPHTHSGIFPPKQRDSGVMT